MIQLKSIDHNYMTTFFKISVLQEMSSYLSQEGIIVEHKLSQVQSSVKVILLLKCFCYPLCKPFLPTLEILCNYRKTGMRDDPLEF